MICLNDYIFVHAAWYLLKYDVYFFLRGRDTNIVCSDPYLLFLPTNIDIRLGIYVVILIILLDFIIYMCNISHAFLVD